MKEKSFLTQRAILLSCIASVMLVGFIDYVTGYELSFFVFYFIPISIGAWMLGSRRAYQLVALSTAIWFVAEWYTGHPYSGMLVYVWNGLIRFIAFFTAGFAVSRIQGLLAEERQIAKELKDALEQVRTLSGLLPICSWCKKIKNDRGYWQKIEEYIQQHSDVQFSHGLCQDCASKVLNDEMSEETADTESGDGLESQG
jgi:hypothetical protein